MKETLRFASVLTLAAAALAARAGILTDSASKVGNQAFTGPLGMAFDVGAASLTVTGLGAYDSGQDGFATGTTISVGIFDRATQALVGSPLTFTSTAPGTLVGSWREKTLATPLTLAAGGRYMIVAQGYGANDLDLNTGMSPYGGQSAATNSASGRLTFVGTSYFDNTSGLTYPTIADTGPEIRYGAGNFTLQPTPEPSALAALSLGAVAVLRRRRRA